MIYDHAMNEFIVLTKKNNFQLKMTFANEIKINNFFLLFSSEKCVVKLMGKWLESFLWNKLQGNLKNG